MRIVEQLVRLDDRCVRKAGYGHFRFEIVALPLREHFSQEGHEQLAVVRAHGVRFQALVGDPTDNVPGVPLIGPKIASQLLQQYGTLEGIWEHVEEIAGKAGVPMPAVYLIPSEQPNAFATGRNPKNAVVAVTEGLLRYLPRDQVRGVLAHEMAHISNRDILVMTIAAMIGAAISAIANILQFSMIFGGRDSTNPVGAIGVRRRIVSVPPRLGYGVARGLGRLVGLAHDHRGAAVPALAGALVPGDRGVSGFVPWLFS